MTLGRIISNSVRMKYEKQNLKGRQRRRERKRGEEERGKKRREGEESCSIDNL